MAQVLVRFSRPPGTATAVFKLAQQAGAEAMLKHWHAAYVPGHFQLSANKRYGYQARVGDDEPPKIPRQDGQPGARNNPHYSWVKRRTKGHNRPLVFTGASERIATSPGNFVVRRQSSNRTRGVFVGLPTSFYKYHKGGVYWRRHMHGGMQAIVLKPQPDKAAELTRVIPSELEDMARVGERRITEFIRHYHPPASGVA